MTMTSHVTWRPASTMKTWASTKTWGERTEVPHWHASVVERVMSVRREMGEAGPSDASIKEMMVLLSRSMWPDTIIPAVVGTFDGGVQIEWHAQGVDLEIRFGPSGTSSGWCDRAGLEAWDSDHGVSVGRLKKELSTLKADG